MGLDSSEPLPSGIQWLTSDVVNIDGLPATGMSYAMQMSFDDNINTYIEPTSQQLVSTSFVAKWDSNLNQWLTPAQYAGHGLALTQSMQGYEGSLATFLNQNYNGSNLSQLAGAWGVHFSVSPPESWVISNSGGGQFAVVPEPFTFALLAAGAVGLVIYGVRRKTRRKPGRPESLAADPSLA